MDLDNYEEIMERFNLYLPNQQLNSFRQVAEKTGYSVAEILRRMGDYCLQEPVLPVIFPVASGIRIKSPAESKMPPGARNPNCHPRISEVDLTHRPIIEV